MTEINFTVTSRQTALITRIVSRARRISPGISPLNLAMDLTACVANGYPLDLEMLLVADDLSFKIDLSAIIAMIDRTTGLMPKGVQLINRVRKPMQETAS